MSFFSKLDKQLQADLISFVEDREAKEKTGKTRVDDALATGILRKIIDGDCRITGCCTNNETKKMFVEFTFYEEENDG
jgi:hypothetical protein